jgi:eukaryotic-like serine/threonine-protein kinase
LIGTRLDKYEVIQKVGEGGMATVYLGRHYTLDRQVAIKVLHPHLSSSQRNRKRFAREARAIEHLRHENILEIYDYSGVDAAECYIITEFVPGVTLAKFREEHGSLPSEVVAIIGLALTEALAYAHDRGILHRDLKPENVMIRRDGEVKLMDFGIARFLNESQVTMTGALVGSPAYMSPEQATEKDLDLRSDLFSLGTLLYEISSGHLPFTGSNPSLILKKIIDGNRPSITELAPTISGTLADIIERLLSTAPEDRYTEASKVADDLRTACAEVNIDATETKWSIGHFLDDPDTYNRLLSNHVLEHLLTNGKAHLEAGEHLRALRLFNRLLSLDENNEEVLQLVQGLHVSSAKPGDMRRSWYALGMTTVIAAVASVLYLLYASEEPVRQISPPAASIGQAAAAPLAPKPVEPAPVLPSSTAPPSPTAPAPSPVEPVQIPKPFADAPPRTAVIVPRPAPAPKAEPVPANVAPGLLRITANYPADVYIGDQRVGNTRDRKPISLPPGSHRVRIASDLIKDQTLAFELAPGEHKEMNVNLQAKPTYIEIDKQFDANCEVSVNGVSSGTAGQLNHRIPVERPDLPHSIRLQCGEISHEHNWEFMVEAAHFPSP